MLSFSESLIEKWFELRDLSPREYLALHRTEVLKEAADEFNHLSDANNAGTRAVIENDVLIKKVVDRSLSIKFFRTLGLSDERARYYTEVLERNAAEEADKIRRMRRDLEALAQTLVEAAGDTYSSLSEVPVGTIPVSYMNAGAAPVPRGGDIVLLNDGLQHLVPWCIVSAIFLSYLMLKQGISDTGLPPVSELLTDIAPESIDEKLEELSELKRQFADLAVNSSSSATDDPRFSMHDYLDAVATGELRERAIGTAHDTFRFILLHEFGHIALGHTQKLREWIEDAVSRTRITEKENSERMDLMRRFEFEADRFAILIIGKLMDGRLEAIVPVVMMGFEIFDQAEDVARENGRGVSLARRTHPFAIDRQIAGHRVLIDQFGRNDLLDAALEGTERLKAIRERLA